MKQSERSSRQMGTIKGFVAGFLLCALLSTTIMVSASSEGIVRTIFYTGIRIFVDGREVIPTDGAGRPVAPFIMDGTTFLPVRAVADAMDMDVSWDGSTQHVYLGRRPSTNWDNRLDRIQYTNITIAPPHWGIGNGIHTFSRINDPITDSLGNTWTNGIILRHGGVSHRDFGTPAPIPDDPDNATLLIDYPLNSQYHTLNGNAVILGGTVDVLFFGDGRLIHRASHITESMHHNFSINVAGVNMLTIKVVAQNRQATSYVHLTDLALYR
ncbi:MAG: copper amine oxidase N-terminal domain-containing protein [Defluviitaleaceae bacterium]|nr:copper amine oxidase N-terminal domain-containing protein [Defluviitaleaceae bacterium]